MRQGTPHIISQPPFLDWKIETGEASVLDLCEQIKLLIASLKHHELADLTLNNRNVLLDLKTSVHQNPLRKTLRKHKHQNGNGNIECNFPNDIRFILVFREHCNFLNLGWLPFELLKMGLGNR